MKRIGNNRRLCEKKIRGRKELRGHGRNLLIYPVKACSMYTNWDWEMLLIWQHAWKSIADVHEMDLCIHAKLHNCNSNK